MDDISLFLNNLFKSHLNLRYYSNVSKAYKTSCQKRMSSNFLQFAYFLELSVRTTSSALIQLEMNNNGVHC